MSERGKGVYSELLRRLSLYAPVMGLDFWTEKPSSPNYPLGWLLSGRHEEKMRSQWMDGDIRMQLCSTLTLLTRSRHQRLGRVLG